MERLPAGLDRRREGPTVTTASTKAGRTLSKLGASKGGKAAAAKLTKRQRSERARKAAMVRWARQKKGRPYKSHFVTAARPVPCQSRA